MSTLGVVLSVVWVAVMVLLTILTIKHIKGEK